MAFQISSIYKSLVRHVMDCVEEAQAEGISPDLQYYSFDSRGDAAELETGDLMGLAGWAFDENDGLWRIHCGVNISTVNDENLFRELEMVDKIHDWFGEDCIIPLRDPQTGEEYTTLKVIAFKMMPASYSEKRNYRPVGLELLRTGHDG